MSIAEIRALLGDISRQRAYQLTTRADFPDPIAVLGEGRTKIWDGAAVRAWAINDGRTTV